VTCDAKELQLTTNEVDQVELYLECDKDCIQCGISK